ncbi:MAG: tetraacyldisaccharide 4'-kinase [Pseudomonadota bacterium]
MSLRSRLERHLNSVWYSSQQPPLLYRGLEQLHRGLAANRFSRPSEKPPVPLIVVGNLNAGGSGKTPAVMALVDALKSRYRVAVISRGYGGQAGAYPLLVGRESNVFESGDEALLIARATKVPVWVDPDRHRAMTTAIEKSGAEVIVSDDGLQHRKLPRSHEICLVDGSRGFGNGHLIPAGPLRQPLSRLDSVDQFLIKSEGLDWPGARRFELEVIGIRSPEGVLDESLAAWEGRSIDALCALANPKQFEASLHSLGIRVRLHAFPDHHCYTKSDLDGLAPPVLTTAKDAVKLDRWRAALDLHVLEVRARLPQETISAVLQHIEEFA